MFATYFLDDTKTYTFRAGVYCKTDKALTLSDLEILHNGKFVPFGKTDSEDLIYYLRCNDLCKDIEANMVIEFKAEIGEMKLHDEDIIDYDNGYTIEDYTEDYGEDILSEYSVIENIINTVWQFDDKCMFNGEAIHLHQLLSDVYREGVIRVFSNPTEIKILGTSEIEEFETHSITEHVYTVV